MYKKILIANRGEIAVRIIRAAREMSIESVAVYHEVDKGAPFVFYADYAVELKSETPKGAYLDIDQIIAAAKSTGAEAIHPGYGFLSENAQFAKAVEDAGLDFIGPSYKAIDAMGSKTNAREIMSAAGIPIIPGNKKAVASVDEALEIASDIGYPVLLKAAAGGGGRGMRRVDGSEDLASAFDSAVRESEKAFGDGSIYIEKLIEGPKHIEIQIFGDKHGNYVHLGERDCSIQRRHQKLIEEAPSTVLDEDLRNQMGEIALKAAKAVNYFNAGTIEFLLDKDKNFYFMEMNTRLQVEHPVTEMVTNIDLAKEQIKVSYGEKLSFTQADVSFTGYAIECRINAEDPFNNFMPDSGKLTYVRLPGGYGVRVDVGIETDYEVTVHFDPMLGKIIAWGRDRIEAINRMERALKNFKIKGVKTVIPFLLTVMRHPEFRYGYFDTGFIEHSFDFDALSNMRSENEEMVAAIAAYAYRASLAEKTPIKYKPQVSKWKERQLMLRRLI